MTPTQKHTNAKALLLAVVLVLGMIVSPVCAYYNLTGLSLDPWNVLDTQKEYFTGVYNFTYDLSPQGKSIMLIHFKVPMSHTAAFTLGYGTNKTVSGSASTDWDLSIIPPTTTISTITFNGETSTYSYFDTNLEWDYFLSGYARNGTEETGIIVYNAGYGDLDNGLAVFMSAHPISQNLIYKIHISSDVPFDLDITYGKTSAVSAAAGKSWLDIMWEWINLAISLAVFVKDTAIALFYWIKFFFWDNLGMTIALYLSISMAYSANTSKDIFKFHGKFLNDQRKLFEFILSLWTTLVNLIAQFRSIFHL